MDTKNIIPEIKRSRAYLIYDTKGKRYLDFYQDSGRAILGHRMEGISRVMKSTVARGLTASYPSIYPNRIEKQLKLLFPDAGGFRIYGNMERAMSSLSEAEGETVTIRNFIDFPASPGRYVFWRPFIKSTFNWNEPDFFITILPFPGDFGPVVVAVNKKIKFLPSSDPLSPMLCDMLIKSISLLIKSIAEFDWGESSVFESSIWDRVGPYLRFKMESDEYSSFYRKALKSLVLLPPDPWLPGIIPRNYEMGQIKDFLDMLRLVESKLSARQ